MKKTTTLLLVVACMLFANTSLMAQIIRPYPISFGFYKISLPINDTVNAIDGQYSGVANAAIVQDSLYRIDFWTGSNRITNLNAPVDSNSQLTALYGYGGLTSSNGDVRVAGKVLTQTGDSAFILEYIAPTGWMSYNLPSTNIDISKIDVFRSNFVVFCSQYGLGAKIITTKDTGFTWQSTPLYTDIKYFTDADFTNISNAVAVGIKDSATGEGILTYSTDTGNT